MGEMYFRPQRHQQGGWAYSYSQAVKRNLPRKNMSINLGKKLSFLSLMFEVADVYSNKAINPSNVLNTSMIVLSLAGTALAAPPIGTILTTIVVIYTATDILVGLATGQSLSDRIDDKYGPLYQFD